jgi:O-antigen ligase
MTRQLKIKSALLWLLCIGTTFLVDPSLTDPFRNSKELFQLPLICLFIGLSLIAPLKRDQTWLPKNAVESMMLISLIAAIIAFSYSPVQLAYGNRIINFSCYLIFMLAVRDYFKIHPRPENLFRGMISAIAIASIYGIFQYFGIDPFFSPLESFTESRWLVAGFTGQQTIFAGVIGPLTPLAFAFANVSKERASKFYWMLAGSVIVLAVILTHTRAIMLAYLLASVLAAIVMLGTRFRKAFKPFMIVACIAAICFLIVYLAIPSFQTRIRDGFNLKSDSVNARLHYWKGSWELIKLKPLFGWGFGSFQYVYPKGQTIVRSRSGDIGHGGSEFVTHPHNEILSLLIEGGVFLTAVILILSVSIFATGLRRIKQHESQAAKLKFGAWLGLIIIAVDSMFSFPFYFASSALIATILSAYVVAEVTSTAGPDQGEINK